MQAASPWGPGTNFNTGTPANLLFTSQSRQLPQQPSLFMQLLTSMMGINKDPQQPKEPYPPEEPYGAAGFGSPGYQPTPEQAARMQQLTSTFPQSRNVVDLRQTPQPYPRQLWLGSQ